MQESSYDAACHVAAQQLTGELFLVKLWVFYGTSSHRRTPDPDSSPLNSASFPAGIKSEIQPNIFTNQNSCLSETPISMICNQPPDLPFISNSKKIIDSLEY